MLGEFANISIGALKTSFGEASLAFTTGLPESVPPQKFSEFAGSCRLQRNFALVMANARVLVRLGVRSKKNLTVAAMSLREGMVVAKDILNGKGALLLRAGTRLSETTVENLRHALGPKSPIEVAAA